MSSSFITGRQFCKIKNRAANRNINFNISIEDINNLYTKQNGVCALSGIKIGWYSTKANGDQSQKGDKKIIKGNASIDRIDSNKDYSIDNIQLVDQHINVAKQSLSSYEFIKLCKKVADYNE